MGLSEAAAGTRGRPGFLDWLAETGAVPRSVRLALLRSLYGTLPIYFGGVLATLSISIILAIRIGTPVFALWATLEIVVGLCRLPVLIACRRAVERGEPGPIRLYALLSLIWAGGIGFGAFIAVDSRDWLAALAACVSSAAMLGGICFRYYPAPQLVIAMLVAMAVPAAAACLLSGEPVLLISGALIPVYVLAMAGAAKRLNATVVRALTAERAERWRARSDPLTGLANRNGLAEAFVRLPADDAIACFYLDLDGFKRVNDTLGHQAGDRLLVIVAERLRGAVPAGAILARAGGDEFIAIMPCSDHAAAEAFGETLASAVAGNPYIIDGQGVFIGASVGAAMRDGDDLPALLAKADDALYRAKRDAERPCVVAAPVADPVPPQLRACG